MALIYSLGDEKIDFLRVIELKLVMEMDQHSRNSGKVYGKTRNSDLLLPIITDTVGLIRKVYINQSSTH